MMTPLRGGRYGMIILRFILARGGGFQPCMDHVACFFLLLFFLLFFLYVFFALELCEMHPPAVIFLLGSLSSGRRFLSNRHSVRAAAVLASGHSLLSPLLTHFPFRKIVGKDLLAKRAANSAACAWYFAYRAANEVHIGVGGIFLQSCQLEVLATIPSRRLFDNRGL